MNQNRINNIKAQNGLMYRSCYYQQILSALTTNNYNLNKYLLSYYALPKRNFKIDDIDLLNNKKYLKTLDFKIVKININLNKLIKLIDNNKPVIMGIDCYYLESRKETYNKKHITHYILVYGYDIEKNEAYVIDHDYINSWNYKKKIISLDNLMLANRMFKKTLCKHNTTSIYIEKQKERNSKTHYIDNKIIKEAYNASKSNLDELINIMENNPILILNDIPTYINYFTKLKGQYKVLSNTYHKLIKESKSIEKLISNYNNLINIVWKLEYVKNTEFINQNITAIKEKIEEIKQLEERIYECL